MTSSTDPTGRAVRRRSFRPLGSLCLLGWLLVLLWTFGTLTPAPLTAAGEKPLEAQHGLVVSVSPPGTDVGLAILQKGGNAVDAAVATAFALAVTYPAA